MSKDIRIRKGLDIKLVGTSELILTEPKPSTSYALIPDDFHGITPRLAAREGDKVQAGSTVFFSKNDERIKIPSPVSGTIKEIRRGAKRKILEIIIEADAEPTYEDFGTLDTNASADKIKELLCKSGCFNFIKQRPYDVIANPDDTPKAIFISAYNSAPLAPDADYLVRGNEKYLQTAIDALAKLTEGKIHVTTSKNSASSPFSQLSNVELHRAFGPHPVGNVSTQIAQVDPINKGEKIWVIHPEDLIVMGELFSTGKLNLERTIAVNGPQVETPQYAKVKVGAKISDILSDFNLKGDHNRIIEGNPISGEKSSEERFLGFYTNQICILEEGDDYDFFGWNRPRPNKFSVLRANMFSFLTPNKKYALNTNTNGEERAFVLTGMYEKVFPLDIYPMHLLKSILYEDIDEMEQLGIYEVAPEDFALTEFVCVSKIQHQAIVRKGLDVMIKEVG